MCSRPFETRSLPSLLAATHRGFTFYVAFPKGSIRPDLSVLPIYAWHAVASAKECRIRPRGSVRKQAGALGNCYLIFARMPSISSLRKARMVWVLTFPNELALRAKAVMVSSSGASNKTTTS